MDLVAAAAFLILLAEPPIIDLMGCESVSAAVSEDKQTILILWRCPEDQAYSVRYRAVGARPALIAKPAPSPTPSPR